MRKLHYFLSVLLLVPGVSSAFTVNPTLIELKPSGKDSTASVVIENKDNKPLNISAFMKIRSHDENGKEKREEFDVKKNFLIMPANLVIKPKGAATIKVVYIGPKEFEKEKAFRLIIANIDPKPFKKFKEKGVSAAVKMLVSYAASVYVTPDKTTHEILVENIKKGEKPLLQVTNNGRKRFYLKRQKILVNSKNLKEQEVYGLNEFPSLASPLLPGEKRIVELPKKSKADPTTANLSFKDE